MYSFNNSFLSFDLKIGSETGCLISQGVLVPQSGARMSNTFLSDICVSRRNEITIRVSREMKINCRCLMEVTREITRELFATKLIHKN